MTRWARADVDVLCGYCGSHLKADAPIHVTIIAGIKKNRVRGQCCAGPAPPDLPARVERSTPVLGGFDSIQTAMPARTRGALKKQIAEWMPYRDSQEREP